MEITPPLAKKQSKRGAPSSKSFWCVDEREGVSYIDPCSSPVKESISTDILPLIVPGTYVFLKGSQRQARVNEINAVSVATVSFNDDGSSGRISLKDDVQHVISCSGCNSKFPLFQCHYIYLPQIIWPWSCVSVHWRWGISYPMWILPTHVLLQTIG